MANLEDLERLDDEELIDLDDSEELEDDVVDELTEEEETEEEPEEIVTDPVLPKPVLPGLSTQVVSVGTKLNVDVTVAIDVTGSMQELIDALKRDVTNLRTLVYDKLNENLSRKRPDRRLNKMRVRVVAFRDYNYDWEAAQQPKHGPMLMSDFFDLDDEEYAGLQLFAKRVAAAIKKAMPCRRVGVAVMGLEVPHAHIHLIPINRESDMNFFKDKLSPTPERMKQIAETIAKEF